MSENKKIAWITTPAFLPVDRFIVPLMKNDFQIDWYIIAKEKETIDFEKEIVDFCNSSGVNLYIERIGHRNLSIWTILDYIRILKGVKRKHYELIYNIMIGIPYYMPLLKWIIGKKKVLVGIHNVHIPKGGSMYVPSKLYTNYTIRAFRYFQTFSESQKRALLSKAPQKYCDNVQFLLYNYGTPKSYKKNDMITFLCFGIIREYKRIDVVINASQRVFELTRNPFRVIIAGACDEWGKYQQLIKYPEIFELVIRRIEDEEIPDLFSKSHYFLMPYQDIAQSGAAMVALNYNLPIIASRLDAFMPYVKEGKTGFLIEPASNEDLVKKMIYVLTNHENVYSYLVDNIETLKKEEFSESSIHAAYYKHFEFVMSQR